MGEDVRVNSCWRRWLTIFVKFPRGELHTIDERRAIEYIDREMAIIPGDVWQYSYWCELGMQNVMLTAPLSVG